MRLWLELSDCEGDSVDVRLVEADWLSDGACVAESLKDCDADSDCEGVGSSPLVCDWDGVALFEVDCVPVRDCVLVRVLVIDGVDVCVLVRLGVIEPVDVDVALGDRDWLCVTLGVCVRVQARGDTSDGPEADVTWIAGNHGEAQKDCARAHAEIEAPIPNPTTPE